MSTSEPVPSSSDHARGAVSAKRRPWLKWAALAVVLGLGGYGIYARISHVKAAAAETTSGGSRRGGGAGRPAPVGTALVRQADLNVRLVALGTVTPFQTVTVRSRVDGQLLKVYFEEGRSVEAGEPLAEIDPRAFEIQKRQAEAQAGRDQALLDNARIDLARFKTLLGQDSVAKQQVDTQEALVRQYEATVKLDQAQLADAALQLDYAHITAPVSGRIGLRLTDVGNMVHASDATGLTVITQLHPISVLFSLPQDQVPRVLRRFQANEPMVVEAYDRDGRTLLATGRLVTVDNQVDTTTGTVKLRAEFANGDDALFPNQFVNVQLIAEHLAGVTVAPTSAVQRGTIGTYVYAVADGKAVVRKVETGTVENHLTAIARGLTPGDVVVVDGVDKLRDGAAVETAPRDAAAPENHPGKRVRENGSAPEKASVPQSP